MRGLAVGLGAAAQGVAVWMALPMLLKRRPIYGRLAAALATVSASALLISAAAWIATRAA
jgi:hypothetical protein